ncbi:MAG: MFS transporter [Acetatifactor sp.]|nr:MFS transporter [Acetatifactor sp.]
MKRKRNIYIMYAIALLQGMVFYGPIATLYRQAQGVSVLQITIIESISLALCLLLEFPWGVLADKIGYRKTMIICNLLYFISKIVFWQASGFAMFLLERILISIVISGLSGVDTALLYLSCNQDDERKRESQQVFGVYNSLQEAGLLIAAFVFSVAVKDNYELSALLTVVSYGIAALCSFGIVTVEGRREDSADTQEAFSFSGIFSFLRQTLKDKSLLLFLVGVALFNETHQIITVFLNQLQYVKCGLSDAAIGYIYILVTIAGLCGFLSSKLTERIGAARTAAVLFAAAAMSCAVLAFTANPLCSVLGMLILRVSFSLLQPLQTEMQNRRITTSNRATALSINAVILDSVGIGTNLVFGALAEYSLAGALLFGVLLCAVGGILYLRNTSK